MKNLILVVFALGFAFTITRVVAANSGNDAATLNQIANYRQWTKVNSEPVQVDIPTSTTDGVLSIPPASPS